MGYSINDIPSMSSNMKAKLQEMLKDGWAIHDFDYWTIEIRKGFHYKEINRSGRCYTI